MSGYPLYLRAMKRAERRHHKDRVLERRKRLARSSYGVREEWVNHKVRYWHFACHCFYCDAQRQADKHRMEREALQFELSASEPTE